MPRTCNLAPMSMAIRPWSIATPWWIPEGDEGDFSAMGIYALFVYVKPEAGTVIVKVSVARDFGLTGDETSWRELETFELLRSIAESIE